VHEKQLNEDLITKITFINDLCLINFHYLELTFYIEIKVFNYCEIYTNYKYILLTI